ncbi:MAG TPA: hypothetical protein VIQ02_06180 [Jiangellaceae bacterium]
MSFVSKESFREGDEWQGEAPPIPDPQTAPKPEPKPEPEPEPEEYDPGAHTIADVQKYVTEHPDELDAVYDAEENGKGRITLLDWLTAFADASEG